MKKLLVTGGLGYIGSHFCIESINKNYNSTRERKILVNKRELNKIIIYQLYNTNSGFEETKVNISFFEEKLFILGGNLSIVVYLISDNVHYREIFLILLLPFIMKLKDSFKIKIFKYLFYFILFRYIFFIFSNYFIMFEKYFTLLYIKAFSDIVLVSLFTAICVIINIKILKQFTKK